MAFMPGASDSSWRAAAEAMWSNGRRCGDGVDDTRRSGEAAVDLGDDCTKAAAAGGRLNPFATGVTSDDPTPNNVVNLMMDVVAFRL